MTRTTRGDRCGRSAWLVAGLMFCGGAAAQDCSCGYPCDLSLSSQTIFSSETHSACLSVVAGPNFVMENTGNVNIRSGESIGLDGGVLVKNGAVLLLTIDPALFCDVTLDLDLDTFDDCLDCNDEESSINPGAVEQCNGLDDNCDGNVDEDNPGGGAACDGSDSDLCTDGITVCSSGSLSCDDATDEHTEVCDGIDNDCDNSIDEGNPGGGAACDGPDADFCQEGILVCSSGALQCDDTTGDTVEICGNGFDDDCDTETDELDCQPP